MAGFRTPLLSGLIAVCGLLPGLLPTASAQSETADLPVVERPTPFSVWLDLRRGSRPPESWPIWIESLEAHERPGDSSQPAGRTVRIRFRRFARLNEYLLIRLQFRDTPLLHPTVTAWSETGTRAFDSGALGTGSGLTRTERMVLPMAGVDYLDIDAPGNGQELRAVQIVSLHERPVLAPLDFEDRAPAVVDPFTAPEEKGRADDADENLMGRVRAVLLKEEVMLRAKEGGAALEFELDGPPLLAVLRLQILNADPLKPPQVVVNRTPAGKLALALPDLADPAWRGETRPLRARMTLRYSGWVQAEIVLPSELLHGGLNSLIFYPAADDAPVAIRGVELQLKYNAPSFDYDLAPLPNP